MKKKAQLFSGEFLLAYFIFMIVLVMALYLWRTTMREITEAEGFYIMEESAVDIAEQLLRTPGSPLNWTPLQVESMGLAGEARVLDGNKLSYFIDMMNSTRYDNFCGNPAYSNYFCFRYLMGLGGYEFYANVTDLNGQTVIASGRPALTGKPPVNERQRITVTRTAILDDQIIRFILTVWEAET